MKKIFLKILTLTFSLTLCLGVSSACGDIGEHICTTFEDGICRECDPNANTGFIYSRILGKPKELIGYELRSLGDCYENDIIIPSKYKGVPILSISDNFASHHGELESVYFEENSKLKTIGEYAFYACENLRSIDIPPTVTEIGDNAFEYCSSLVYIVIPNSVTSIGNHAFRFCHSIKNIEIPKSVSTIPYGLFEGCNSLESVIIPSSVISINEKAFTDCAKLTNIIVNPNNLNYITIDGSLYTIDGKTLIQYAIGKEEKSFKMPNSVTTIANYAFYNCKLLESIEISSNVTSIGHAAFFNCNLQFVNLPKDIISIEGSAFSGCCKIKSINLDNNNENYKTIDGNLYTKDGQTLIVYARGKLDTHFEIPNTVTTIEYNAFRGCASLESVVIPHSVTSIGSCAFYDCVSLSSIAIPSSITTIGGAAFYNCDKLVSIVIPKSVEWLGYGVFAECDLITIYCEAESKPADWDSRWNYPSIPFVWGYKGN